MLTSKFSCPNLTTVRLAKEALVLRCHTEMLMTLWETLTIDLLSSLGVRMF